MVRLLYKEGLIEKFGEKPSSAPKALKKSDQIPVGVPVFDQGVGQKRKASTELDSIKFDENGNWTLETAKTRLSKFYQAQGLDFNEPLQCNEVGFPPNKQYQCKFTLQHEGQEFNTCIMADNKKSAQRRACLDMVIKLYKSGLIPGNKGDRFGPGGNFPKRGRGNGRGRGMRGGYFNNGMHGRNQMKNVGMMENIGANPPAAHVPKQESWDMNGGFKTFASM